MLDDDASDMAMDADEVPRTLYVMCFSSRGKTSMRARFQAGEGNVGKGAPVETSESTEGRCHLPGAATASRAEAAQVALSPSP